MNLLLQVAEVGWGLDSLGQVVDDDLDVDWVAVVCLGIHSLQMKVGFLVEF